MTGKTTNAERLKAIISKNIENPLARQQALNYLELIELYKLHLEAVITVKNQIIQVKSEQIMEFNNKYLGTPPFNMEKNLKDTEKGVEFMRKTRKRLWREHKYRVVALKNKLDAVIADAQKEIGNIYEEEQLHPNEENKEIL